MSERKYFGTDGIRGRVGSELINSTFAKKLGFAAGTVFCHQQNAVVVIGRDTRESGASLQQAMQAGFMQAGVDVIEVGIIPTPAIAWLTQALKACAGVVISASHNRYQDNGFKIFSHEGSKLSDTIELEIEACLDQEDFQTANREGKLTMLADAGDRYCQFCMDLFAKELSLTDIKIVLDCANGSTYRVAPVILKTLGAHVIEIASRPDGKNINADCGATALQGLANAVVSHQANLGIAFDGDGDRVMAVDEKGEIVDGDQILCILINSLITLQKPPVGVVGTVMSNLGLEQALKKMNIPFVRAKVGDRYVLEMLLQRQWQLGGENSGHIINLNYTTTGDGIISALQLLRAIVLSKQPLSQLKTVMIKRPQVLINVPVSTKVKLEQYPVIQKAVREAEAILNGSGRVLLRPSGTEPLIRVMVEGNDEMLVRKTAEVLADKVTQAVLNKGVPSQ